MSDAVELILADFIGFVNVFLVLNKAEKPLWSGIEQAREALAVQFPNLQANLETRTARKYTIKYKNGLSSELESIFIFYRVLLWPCSIIPTQ